MFWSMKNSENTYLKPHYGSYNWFLIYSITCIVLFRQISQSLSAALQLLFFVNVSSLLHIASRTVLLPACHELYALLSRPPLCTVSAERGRLALLLVRHIVSAHCCHIAENSAILLIRSGTKLLFAEKVDSGTAIKVEQNERKKYFSNFGMLKRNFHKFKK